MLMLNYNLKNLSISLNQTNILELEEEVKLLKNLKHPNIVVSVSLSDFDCLMSNIVILFYPFWLSFIIEILGNCKRGRFLKYSAGVCTWWIYLITIGKIRILPWVGEWILLYQVHGDMMGCTFFVASCSIFLTGYQNVYKTAFRWSWIPSQ
jgi:hypothetical protein